MLSRHSASLLETQKGFASLVQRLLRLEKQTAAVHGILGRLEACSEDVRRFFEDIRPLATRRFVKMRNKKVWFDRANAALFPMFEAVALPVFDTSRQPMKNYPGMDFEGFRFLPMTQREFRKSFMANTGNPYLQSAGGFSHFPEGTYNTVILTKEIRGKESHWCWVNGRDGWYSSGGKVTMVPVCRLHVEDSPGLDAVQTVRIWFAKDLIPHDLSGELTKRYGEMMGLWKGGYLDFGSEAISLKKRPLLLDVLSGKFRSPVFGRPLDFAAELESVVPHELPVPTAKRKPGSPAGTPGPEPRESEKRLMDEKNRVPLTRDRLERGAYPQKVYYDGSLLVDTFITANGNYVQGYVAAGIYRVASVNPVRKTVLLYHTENAKKLFQKNPGFHSVFETFSVPFGRVFVPGEPRAVPASEKNSRPGEESREDVDWEALADGLKRGHAALEGRLLALEQQMKELRSIKDAPSPAKPSGSSGSAQGGRAEGRGALASKGRSLEGQREAAVQQRPHAHPRPTQGVGRSEAGISPLQQRPVRPSRPAQGGKELPADRRR